MASLDHSELIQCKMYGFAINFHEANSTEATIDMAVYKTGTFYLRAELWVDPIPLTPDHGIDYLVLIISALRSASQIFAVITTFTKTICA